MMPDEFADLRTKEAMEARSAAVRKQHDAAMRGQKQAGSAKTIAVVGLALGLAWTVYNNARLAEKAYSPVIVYAVLQPNGEWIASDHYTAVVPGAAQEQNIQNALWTYVKARDCYKSSSFIQQSYEAQAMSDERVGRQVRAQFDLTNPEAPQHVYGEHNIAVQCEAVDPPTPINELNNEYYFRFRRFEDNGHATAAEKAAAPIYTVTIKYRTDVYPKEDHRRAWLDRTTFNAAGVQVVEYSGAKPTSAVPTTRKQANN